MIHIFNHEVIQKNQLINDQEMNPITIIIKNLIQNRAVNYHCLRSTVEPKPSFQPQEDTVDACGWNPPTTLMIMCACACNRKMLVSSLRLETKTLDLTCELWILQFQTCTNQYSQTTLYLCELKKRKKNGHYDVQMMVTWPVFIGI